MAVSAVNVHGGDITSLYDSLADIYSSALDALASIFLQAPTKEVIAVTSEATEKMTILHLAINTKVSGAVKIKQRANRIALKMWGELLIRVDV